MCLNLTGSLGLPPLPLTLMRPLFRYGRLEFKPQLPGPRSQLCQRMPMGSIIKTVTFYKTAWWRNKGFTGSVLR